MKEEWRPLPIAEFSTSYEVSNFGRVRGIARMRRNKAGSISPVKPRMLSVYEGTRGYMSVFLRANGKAKCAAVHRLVALAFIPNPASLPEVNHIDFDKTNNVVTNLEWLTRVENYLHAATNGQHPFPRVITETRIESIRRWHQSGVSQRLIAAQFGVTQSTVSRIINGKRRKHCGLLR
jgi:hypothetical protein